MLALKAVQLYKYH